MTNEIFISYAWEKDEKNDEKIKSFTQWLAVYLRKWNFKVSLDVFENHPGTNLDEFMEKGINNSRFVLCICTETYINKMDHPETGVSNEINLLNKRAKSPFVIPIIDKDKKISLPNIFKGKYYCDLLFGEPYSQKNQQSIFELISTLRDESLSLKTVNPENRIDNYYNDVKQFKIFSDAVTMMNFESQIEDTITFQYLLNDGAFKIGLGTMEFITNWSNGGEDGVYSYKKTQRMLRIHNFTKFKAVKKPVDIKKEWLLPVNWAVYLKVGDGILWINDKNFLAVGKILAINLNKEDEYKSTLTLAYKVLNPVEISDDFTIKDNSQNKE